MKRGSDRKKLIRDLVLAGSLLLAAVILLLVINEQHPDHSGWAGLDE